MAKVIRASRPAGKRKCVADNFQLSTADRPATITPSIHAMACTKPTSTGKDSTATIGFEAIRAYHTTVSPLFETILANTHQSRILATLRDTLLSGELRVKEAYA